MAEKGKRFPKEFRAQILNEIKDTGNMAEVARKHKLSYQTVISWVNAEKRSEPKAAAPEKKTGVEARIKQLEFENRTLKELLSKMNQLLLGQDTM